MPGVAILDGFSCEGQVVKACFCSDFDAVGSGLSNQGYGFNGGKVYDMER